MEDGSNVSSAIAEIPGVSEKGFLGENARVVPIPEGVRFARNLYNEQGDVTDRVFGIQHVGIGSKVWQIKEPNGNGQILVESDQPSIPEDHSRIRTGYMSSDGVAIVDAQKGEPFGFDDPDRLNMAADLGTRLNTELETNASRDRVEALSGDFVNALRSSGVTVDSSILESIAILEKNLRANRETAPDRLEEIAKQMRESRIAGVNLKTGNFPPSSGLQPDGTLASQYSPEVVEQEAQSLRNKLEKPEQTT